MITLVASKVGELAVWRVANFGSGNLKAWKVENPLEAIHMINAVADADLENEGIGTNAFGLVEWDGEEWVEWYHPDTGESIEEYENTLEELEANNAH